MANAFIAAAVASMDENEIEFAKEILAKAEPQLKAPDISAIIQAEVESLDSSFHSTLFGFNQQYISGFGFTFLT